MHLSLLLFLARVCVSVLLVLMLFLLLLCAEHKKLCTCVCLCGKTSKHMCSRGAHVPCVSTRLQSAAIHAVRNLDCLVRVRFYTCLSTH